MTRPTSMARKASQNPQEPGAHVPVLRCDVLAHAMNPGKERALRAMLALWRGHAGIVGAALWRRFQETGLIDGLYDAATQARKDLARRGEVNSGGVRTPPENGLKTW